MKTRPDDLISAVVSPEHELHEGLSKREYFGAAALTGMLARGDDSHYSTIAEHAILYADKLIEELNRE